MFSTFMLKTVFETWLFEYYQCSAMFKGHFIVLCDKDPKLNIKSQKTKQDLMRN